MLQKDLHLGTRNADECEAKEDVRWHPSPASVPALEQSQNEAEPDPMRRDGASLTVAYEEEEGRSR